MLVGDFRSVSSTKRSARFGWPLLLVGAAIVSQICAGTLFTIVTCSILLSSAFLTGKCFNLFDLRRVTIGTFWYLSYLVMIFFPAFFVYANQLGPYRSRYLFGVESVLVTVPIGWWIASDFFGFQKENVERYFARPIDSLDSSLRLYRRLRVFLLALLILTGLYLHEVGTIPLFYLFRHPGEYMQLVLLREDSFKLLESPLKYLYALARGVGYPLLILVSLGALLQYGKKKWRALFAISLVMGVFFAALSLAKAPVAVIFLMLAVFFYLYKGGTVSRKVVVAFLALIFLFPLGVVLGISPKGATVSMAVAGTSYRLLYDPADEIYYYFEVFPSHVQYLNGRAIGKVASLLGEPYFDTPNYVGLYQSPHGLESTNANAGFIADLNADFGMWGVVLGGVLAGIIMQSIQIYIFRRRKTVVNLAVFAFLVVTFWYLHSVSLPVVLASNGAILVLVIGWLLERSPLDDQLTAVMLRTAGQVPRKP